MRGKWILGLMLGASACVGQGDEAFSTTHELDMPEIASTASALITKDVVDCESGSSAERALCSVVLARVNAELDERGITIDKDGLLFTYDDPTNQAIPTGHSCTVEAKVKNKHATVRLGSDARLDLSGNSLTRPLALKVDLPVAVDAKIDVKQTFGNRLLFGSCNTYASDSYSFKASASTTAELLVAFSFNPSFGEMPSGDYAITLKPTVAVGADLQNLQLDFKVSGVNPITPVWGFVTGTSSTLLKATDAAVAGNSVKEVFASAGAWDVASLVVLGIGALPGPAERAIWDFLLDAEARRARAGVDHFQLELQQSLQSKLAQALKLDNNGKRVIMVKREYVELIQQLGNGALVFADLPVDPSIACRTQAENQCRGCGQSGQPFACAQACGAAQGVCNALADKYKAQFPATPMQPVFKPEPAPVTTPPANNKAAIDKCNAEAASLCSSCRGCAECQTKLAQCKALAN
jgi:hypothetical protein